MEPRHSDRMGQAQHAGARARVAGLAEPLRRQLWDAAERQKNFTADQLINLAKAVRHGAEEMHATLPFTAVAVQTAAGRVESFLASWRGRRVDNLAPAINRFAQDRPAAVFAGAVLAGFLLTQLLKARRSSFDSRH